MHDHVRRLAIRLTLGFRRGDIEAILWLDCIRILEETLGPGEGWNLTELVEKEEEKSNCRRSSRK
jgi:hypothetical protein